MAEENGFLMAAEVCGPLDKVQRHTGEGAALAHEACMCGHARCCLAGRIQPVLSPRLLLNTVSLGAAIRGQPVLTHLFILFSVRSCIVSIFDNQNLNFFLWTAPSVTLISRTTRRLIS